MGNIVKTLAGISNEEPVVAFDYSSMDKYDKVDLTNFIKTLESKNINLPDDLNEAFKSLELETTKLLPMSIELYKKMFELFGEYKHDKSTKKHTQKRMYFVKPQFSVGDVKATVVNRKDVVTPEFINLMPKYATTTDMKMGDITLEEYNESFNNTLTKKDMMGITKKILRDIPTYHKTRFINAFNKILDGTMDVNEHAVGKGTFIYKVAKGGEKKDINSYRQIISIPNVVSQLHRILTIRLTNYMHANKIIDTTIQKGGISGQKFSIFEQYYKLKNVLRDANKKKKQCNILFLDISNAFGSVNLNQLYKVLDHYGVSEKFTTYLKKYYDNLEYYVDLNGTKTENYKWKDMGLIQGSALSPLLFVLCINYILEYLTKTLLTECGYELTDKVKIMFVAYMDDICLITNNQESLKKLYNEIVKLFSMFGLDLNRDKTVLMTVNLDKKDINDAFKDIKLVSTTKYLGEYLASDGTSAESYVSFLRTLSGKLHYLQNRKISNEEKINFFTSILTPWINRKTMIMYDLTKTQKLKIVSIIKPHLDEWKNSQSIDLFYNILPILKDSEDDIIKNVEFNNETFDEEIENDIDLTNYVMKNANITLLYNEMNDDTALELEIQHFESLTKG